MPVAALTLAAVLALAAQPECGAGSGVAANDIAAIAQVESGLNPLAIHVNGENRTIQPDSVSGAIRTASNLINSGRSIDLGLMQINSANLARHRLSIAMAFDACSNMRAGAEHFADDMRAALSRYNTGHMAIINGYPAKVMAARAALPPPKPATVAVLPRPSPFTKPVSARELTYTPAKRT